jgi:acetyl-CoA carboxylase biotin carboxyl carrier protein
MDLARIKELIELMAASGVSELEVKRGEESVRIVRPLAPSPQIAGRPVAAPGGREGAPEGVPVRAPMAGTFYAAPEPGAEPFVQVGQSVRQGEVLCIIESMKMMNEIVADRSGVCVAVTARSGEPVSAGDTLLRIA